MPFQRRMELTSDFKSLYAVINVDQCLIGEGCRSLSKAKLPQL